MYLYRPLLLLLRKGNVGEARQGKAEPPPLHAMLEGMHLSGLVDITHICHHISSLSLSLSRSHPSASPLRYSLPYSLTYSLTYLLLFYCSVYPPNPIRSCPILSYPVLSCPIPHVQGAPITMVRKRGMVVPWLAG